MAEDRAHDESRRPKYEIPWMQDTMSQFDNLMKSAQSIIDKRKPNSNEE